MLRVGTARPHPAFLVIRIPMKFCLQLPIFILIAFVLSAHSPWGQYQVYRQKHLLIMSTIDDEPTYPFSKKLVAAINEVLPHARARPARAKHFQRVHSLFSTKQMQVMLLSRSNAVAALNGEGPFAAHGSLDFRVLYQFGDIQLLGQVDFPDQFAWLVTDAIIRAQAIIEADTPNIVLELPNLHPGSLTALKNEPMPPLPESM